MRLVEGIAGKRLDKCIYLFGDFGSVAVLFGAPDEVGFFLYHHLGFFLAHRLAEDICLPQTVAAESAHDKEHLLLINDDAVGLL